MSAVFDINDKPAAKSFARIQRGAGKTGKAMDDLAGRVDRFERGAVASFGNVNDSFSKMATNVGRGKVFKSTSVDANTLIMSLDRIVTELKATGKAFDGSARGARGYRKETKSAADTLALLAKKQDAANRLMRDGGVSARAAGAASRAYSKDLDKLGDEGADLARKLDRSQRETLELSAAQRTAAGVSARHGSAIGALAGKVVALVAAYVGIQTVFRLVRALALGSIDAFADLQDAVVSLRKVTDELGDKGLGRLVERLEELSTGPIPIATENLIELAAVAGQLGIETEAGLANAAATGAKLAASTDLAGDVAIKGLARILAINREAVDQIDNAGAALVKLGNTSKATESEILPIANEIARSTANFRIGSSAIFGFAGALAEMGAKAEGVGSALADLFGALLRARETGEGLEDLARIAGVTADELRTMTQGNIADAAVQFLKGLGTFGDRGALALEEVGLASKRTSKALLPMAANADRLADRLRVSSQASKENTALNKEAAQAFGTLRSQGQRVQNAFRLLLSDGVKPLARPMAGILSDTVDLIGAFRDFAKALRAVPGLSSAAGVALDLLTRKIREPIQLLESLPRILSLLAGLSLGNIADQMESFADAIPLGGGAPLMAMAGAVRELEDGFVSLALATIDETSAQEDATDEILDGAKAFGEAEDAADDFKGGLKAVQTAMSKLQATAVRQRSVVVTMQSLGVSAAEAGQIVSTLTAMQVEAGIEGLAAANAVAELLSQGQNDSVDGITAMVEVLSEANEEAALLARIMEAMSANVPRFSPSDLAAGRAPIETLPVSGGVPTVSDIASDFERATEKSDEVFNRFLDGLVNAGQNLEGSLGLFASGMADFLARSKAEGASFGGLIQSFQGLLSSLIGGKGPAQIGRFGGTGSGDFSEEGAAIGQILGTILGGAGGGAIGGLLGQAAGKAIKIEAEKAIAEFHQVGDELAVRILADPEGLSETTRDIARAILGQIEGFADAIGASFNLGDLDFRLQITGDDIVSVFFDGVEKQFSDVNAAIDFALAQLIRKGEFTGVGPNVQDALAGLAGVSGGSSVALDILPTQQEIDELFSLATALDEFQSGIGPTGVALQELAVDTNNAVEVAVRFGLDVGAVFELMDAGIRRTLDNIEGRVNDLLGVGDHFSAAFDLAKDIEDVQNAIIKAEEDGLARREELARRALALGTGVPLGLGAGGGGAGPTPTLESVAAGEHSLEELAAFQAGLRGVTEGLLVLADQNIEMIQLLQEELDAGAITQTEFDKQIQLLESHTAVATDQMVLLNAELEALEGRGLPDLPDPDLLRKTFDASILGAGDSLASLFSTLSGFTANQEALEAVRHQVTMDRLRAELVNLEIALATAINLSAAAAAAGEELRQNIIGALEGLASGAITVQRPGGGRGGGRRAEALRAAEAEAEATARSAESFAEAMLGFREELSATSAEQLALNDRVEEFRELAAEAGVGTEQLAEGIRLMAEVDLQALGEAWETTANLFRRSDLEGSVREIGQRRQAAIEATRLREDLAPEAATEAQQEIRQTARREFEALGKAALDGLGGPFRKLAKDASGPIKAIEFIAANLDKLRITANQLAATVRGQVVPQLLDMAIAAAEAAGKGDEAEGLRVRRADIQLNLQLADLAVMKAMLAASDALTPNLLKIFDQTADWLQEVGSIDPPGDVLPDVVGLSSGISTLSTVVTSFNTESFDALIDSLRNFLTTFNTVGVGQFEAQATTWADAFTRFNEEIADAMLAPVFAGGPSGIESLESFSQDLFGAGLGDLNVDQLDVLKAALLATGSEAHDALADLVDLFVLSDELATAEGEAVGKLLDLFSEPLNEAEGVLDPIVDQFLDLVEALNILGASEDELIEAQGIFMALQLQAIAEFEDALKAGIRGRIEDLQLLSSSRTNKEVFDESQAAFEALAATALDESLTNEERVEAVEGLAAASQAFEDQILAFLGAGPQTQPLLDAMLATLLQVNAADILVPTELDSLQAQAASLAQIELTTGAQPTEDSLSSKFSTLATSFDTSIRILSDEIVDALGGVRDALIIPAFHSGGFMPSDGLASLRGGERVLSPGDTVQFDAGRFSVPVASTRGDDGALVEEVRALRVQVAEMAKELKSQTGTIETVANMEADRDDVKARMMADNLAANRTTAEHTDPKQDEAR